MNDMAPTPGQVLDSLVARFAPAYDPTLPFHDPKSHAKKRLAAAMLIEAYGPAHALSRIVSDYSRYEHRLNPSGELCDTLYEDMQEAWEDLSDQIQQELP